MVQVLLLSVLIATVTIPVLAARARNPVRGMKLTVFYAFSFFFLFMVAVKYVYPRIAGI